MCSHTSFNLFGVVEKLHDVFEALGCKMLGYTSTEGYLHEASKAIRGDSFCGLLLDAVNQEEMTEERVKTWVSQLIEEGILESSGAASPTVAVSVPSSSKVDVAATEVEVAQNMPSLESETSAGYIAHYNPRNDKTMWISADGRSSYVTAGAP